MKKILVLIPFFNEVRNVHIIDELTQYLNSKEGTFKFLFCNDNSSDNTEELLSNVLKKNNCNFEILRNYSNLGHGGSLLHLAQSELISDFNYVLTLDFDFCYDLSDLDGFFNEVNNDFVVVGKRKFFDEGIFRQLITTISELTVLIKTHFYFKDTNCPIRLYPIEKFLEIWSKIPEKSLTPNIFATLLLIRDKHLFKRVVINKNKAILPKSVSWGNNFFLKKIKIIKFSFNSFRQLFVFK